MSSFTFKALISIILAIFLSSFHPLAMQKDTVVCWEKHHKLQWVDYQGQPNASYFASAITVANLEVYPVYDKKDKRYEYKVSNTFNKQKSWVKPDISPAIFSEMLLEHEQLHFDISELYSRRLRCEFEKIEKTQKKQVKDTVYQQIIQKLMDERDIMEELYDKETNHGRIVKKQDEWQEKLNAELLKLDKYSSTTEDCKK